MCTQHIVASWTCHVISAVHSAVVHFLSPDQSSGTHFQTNWETTLKTVVLGSHWKHCYSASTSVPSVLEVYLCTWMRYINRLFTHSLTELLTYLGAFGEKWHKLHHWNFWGGNHFKFLFSITSQSKSLYHWHASITQWERNISVRWSRASYLLTFKLHMTSMHRVDI